MHAAVLHGALHPYAGVVKLVDALDSKSSDLMIMSVRLRPPAPFFTYKSNRLKGPLDFLFSVVFICFSFFTVPRVSHKYSECFKVIYVFHLGLSVPCLSHAWAGVRIAIFSLEKEHILLQVHVSREIVNDGIASELAKNLQVISSLHGKEIFPNQPAIFIFLRLPSPLPPASRSASR